MRGRHAACGAGERKRNRKPCRLVRADHAACRVHDLDARGRHARFQRRQIPPGQRAGERVEKRRAQPLVFARDRRDLVRAAHPKRVAEGFFEPSLVVGRGEAEKQRDRRGLVSGRLAAHLGDRALVQRRKHIACRRAARAHADDVFARDPQALALRRKAVERRAGLPADERHVLEARVDDDEHARTLALQDAVRDDRRAVHELEACACAEHRQSRFDRGDRIARRG